MKKRSRFTVVTKLIGLVKPLTAYMALAVIMGIVRTFVRFFYHDFRRVCRTRSCRC